MSHIIATDKSHVALGCYLDPLDGTEHDEVVLLDKHLRATLPAHGRVHLGWKLKPEHQKLRDAGYIGIIGIDPDKTPKAATLENVHRTGKVMHVKLETFEHFFGPAPDKGICCMDDSVVEQLCQWYETNTGEQPQTAEEAVAAMQDTPLAEG